MQVAHQNCVYTCQTPGQEALAVSLEKEIKRLGTTNSFFYKMATDLKRRRKFDCVFGRVFIRLDIRILSAFAGHLYIF